MERPSWAPAEVDIDRPSAARVYDWLLGGSHNFAVDREVARRLLAMAPDAARTARQNRAFLGRAVRFLIRQGVRQFLDLGSGMATPGSTHEVAHRVDPGARVVYLDIDPVTVAHTGAMLATVPHTCVVSGDLRQPEDVLADPGIRRLIDPTEPVGILLLSVLHFIPDTQTPADIVAGYLTAAAPGSFLVLSHLTVEAMPNGSAQAMVLYNEAVDVVYPRTRPQIAALFGQLRLVEPGLEYLARWRPDPGTAAPDVPMLCGVGRKD